ncbi:STAS-like domain-containing protein [Solidesulfovibrio sp. C21]|uniref:STAS-like domain-containing protein n=1 Tax=Solidesulfovibrio sp. C21 TaxID=3398613 RepID=UPI0039FD91C9
MVVRVLDYVVRCSTEEDGDAIFKVISPLITRRSKVTVSFEGVTSTTSSFVNAAFIELLGLMSFEELKTYLWFTNSTQKINALIKKRFQFETESRQSNLAYA